ncbi:MAG: DUF262 domain-containing protein [Dehalococcoidia bacterium]
MGSQLTISELISAIGNKDLILPEFQRGYVWNTTQVREYLQSLYRGYPTGSFLIWKTPNPGLVRGAGARDDSGNVFQLILDGQQRLTSVYTLMQGEPPPFYEGEKALYFDIRFNVRTEEFAYYKPSAMKGLDEWLPVTPFLKTGLGKYLGGSSPVPAETRAFLMDYFDPLQRLDSIRSYSYYLDTLTQREMDEVVRIFNLVNKQGTPLTKADLALSHICALWPEARQAMSAAQDECKKGGFEFDLSFFVRCMAAVATQSGVLEPIYKVDVSDIRAAWERARKAIADVLNTLRSHAYIDSGVALVSNYVLIPLVVFLANGSGSFRNENERNEFLHWMYAALMWNRYGGSAETKLNQDIQALKGDDPARRLRDAIIAERGRIKVEGRDLVNASTRTGFSTMAYVVARSRKAVDWSKGNLLYNDAIGKSNGLEYHHIFPQTLLYAPKGKYNPNLSADRQRVNEIANIAYLTSAANKEISGKSPETYFPWILGKFPTALEAQSVPMNPGLRSLDKFEDFLEERRELLAGGINTFMSGLLASGDQQQATVRDYIAAGESDTVEFKMSMRWDYKQGVLSRALEKVVARTIAAFMNAKGGTLVIGVSDEGDVCGIEADLKTFQAQDRDLDHWEQHLRNVLNNLLGKEICALVEASFAGVDGKTVALLRADAHLKPVFLFDGGAAEFHVRSGNTSQLLDVKQANSYIASHFPVLV